MKYLALTVLLAIVQASPPVPGKAANAPAGSSHNVAQDARNNQSAPNTHPAVPKNAAKDQAESNPPSDADTKETIVITESAPMPIPRADWWYRAYVIFTGALVVVGAIGIGYAIKTLNAIERQARIMEVAYVQWIDVGNWKVTDDTTDEKRRLCVRVEITNSSRYPLTITEGEIKLVGHDFPGWYVKDNFFPPHTPRVATLYVYITEFEYQRMFKAGGELGLTVKGGFTYVDVLKRRRKQTVEGRLGCNESRTDFTPQVSMKPQNDNEEYKAT